MINSNFFIPIKYTNPNKTLENKILEQVDNYFYLGGKKAYVLQGRTKDGKEKVILSQGETEPSKIVKVAKFVSYLTGIIPLIMFGIKIVLRSTHCFKVIDPEAKLQKGIDITEDITTKIHNLMPFIKDQNDFPGIEWLSRGNNLVFKLAGISHLVFKMVPQTRGRIILGLNKGNDARFANMVKAKEVCLVNQLGLLTIPHARKIQVDGITLIVEETLDFNPNESIQEEFYHTYSTHLNETARQLAVFVAKTGFNDLTWRNIPLLKGPQEPQKPLSVALIDLEHMQSVVNGFIGHELENGSRGLIKCLSKSQIDIVIEEARKLGLNQEEELQKAKEARLQELESNERLSQFYRRKNIVTGKELIQVENLKSLGLDFNRTWNIQSLRDGEEKTISLEEMLKQVISTINNLIQQSPDENTPKGKRYVRLDMWSGYQFDDKEACLDLIINALIQKEHLFKLIKIENVYFVQA